MANVRWLVKFDPICQSEEDLGIKHLPGSRYLGHETLCGFVDTIGSTYKEGKGHPTCQACINAARELLENLTDAEIKQLRPRRAARRAVATPPTTETVSTPCPICGAHGHIGDCEGD